MSEETTARYKFLVAKHGLHGPVDLLERLDAVYTLMENYGGVMRDRGLLLDKKDQEIADLTSKLKEAEHAVSQAQQQRDEDVHVLEHARDEARRKYERAYDCHEEPEGCGACISCLLRKLDALEKEPSDRGEHGQTLVPATDEDLDRRYAGMALAIAQIFAEGSVDAALPKVKARLLQEFGEWKAFSAHFHTPGCRWIGMPEGLNCCQGSDAATNGMKFWAERDAARREVAELKQTLQMERGGPPHKDEPSARGGSSATADGKLDHLALSIAEIFSECDSATAVRRTKARLQKLVAETKAWPSTGTRPESRLKLPAMCADGLCSHRSERECWDAAKAAKP